MKKVIILFIVVSLFIFIIYQGFFKEKKPEFNLVEVIRGTVLQEVSETGQVKKGKELNLTFKNAGKIEKIFVEVDQEVKRDEILAELETAQLRLQLKEAKANLEAQKAKLAELEKGTRAEEIQISQTLLDKVKNELNNLYQDTPLILNQSYNLAENAIRQTIAPLFIQRYPESEERSYYELSYRYCNDSAANEANYRRKFIENDLKNWSIALQNIQIASTSSLETLILKSENYLLNFQEFLNILNNTFIINCNLQSQEINTLNNYKLLVNQALTNVNSALNSLVTHGKSLESQKFVVQNYQEQLNLKLAGTRPEQISYQEAQVKLAEIKVELLKNQLEDTILRSPTDGQVIKINKKEGETVQSITGEIIITLLPVNPFQIEVDIYEEDVVKIKVGNPVDISLVAFPDQIFKGKVVAIDPAEKLTEGVVYYKVTIDPALIHEGGVSEGVKLGMTADVLIKTASKENVLVIPAETIQEKNGKTIVQVLKNGKIEEREIEIGLRGSYDLVEVISGIGEGEKVIKK